MSERIFIFCDDPAHPRRVAVTNFVPVTDDDAGAWTERFTSAAAQGRRESGVTLVDDALPSGYSFDPDEYRGREVRSRYQLVCRKCRRRPVTAREETLFAVLNALHGAGVSEVSLTLLAASLQRQSERE